MADAIAHGRVVLARVIGEGGLPALNYAADKLGPEHFTDKVQRVLFQMLAQYARENEGIMTREALADLMRGRPPGSVAMYGEGYDLLAGLRPEDHEFSHSVGQLRELAADRATGDALAVGLRILNPHPGEEEVRDERTGAVLSGHADARAYVVAEFAAAEAASGSTDSPGGDVTAEGDDILAEYARVQELRAAGKVPGIEFGIPALDRHLDGGLGHGELGLVAAGMSGGKSSLCAQCGWYNAVEQGKNVVIFTTEQHRTALRIKLVARHSRQPQFGLPRGLDTRLIRAGRLGAEGERALAAVVADLKTGDYGRLEVVQMPESATLPVMAARAESLARQVVPDLVIVDYLQLFDPVQRTRESRLNENLSGILKGARGWARSFRKGQGVPLISPWQVNKEGIREMRGRGEFSQEDLSDTIEAGRTPSLILGLMVAEEDETAGRAAPMFVKVLKNRDGPKGAKFPLVTDYATCFFADREDMMAEEDYFGLDGS
jgi:replicative DNA helicase